MLGLRVQAICDRQTVTTSTAVAQQRGQAWTGACRPGPSQHEGSGPWGDAAAKRLWLVQAMVAAAPIATAASAAATMKGQGSPCWARQPLLVPQAVCHTFMGCLAVGEAICGWGWWRCWCCIAAITDATAGWPGPVGSCCWLGLVCCCWGRDALLLGWGREAADGAHIWVCFDLLQVLLCDRNISSWQSQQLRSGQACSQLCNRHASVIAVVHQQPVVATEQ
jgi:hypothetical protein